ncbi:hypothetical protein ACFQDN_14535 [Pseudomonas asuensis]|uniref:ATP-binding protein n=1 Tax=Pseudomonas asuensis TaxID=1825787 RepID=A0ABQ2H1V9_9PSED|nr:hypothetical protein [Pseudomonas asuensis]GGM23705.1 hypothetical protein GCM10009425_38240 [Pseudomonas asuensis]
MIVTGSGGVGKSMLLRAAFPERPILILDHLTNFMSVTHDELESGSCFLVDDAHRFNEKQTEWVVSCLNRLKTGYVISFPQVRISRNAPIIEYSLSIKLVLALQQDRGHVIRIFLDKDWGGEVIWVEQVIQVKDGKINILSEIKPSLGNFTA